MAALPVDLDAEEISAGHGGAVKNAHLPRRQIPFHMGAETGIHMDMMVAEIPEHRRNAPFPHFLRFLKHENHFPFPFILVKRKDFGLRQEHGHMAVMAAGMHDSLVFRNAHPLL